MTDYSDDTNTTKTYNGEGNGFYPEAWSSNEDLNETVFSFTKDEKMKDILKEIF